MCVFYTGEFYTVSLLQDTDHAGGCQAAGRTCLVLCFVFVGQGREGSSLAPCDCRAPNKVVLYSSAASLEAGSRG